MKIAHSQRKNMASRLDALPTRSRILLFFGFLLVLFFVWHQLWASPLQQSRRQLQGRLAQTGAHLAELEAQAAAAGDGSAASPDDLNRRKTVSLEQEIAILDADLQRLTGGMISAKEMAVFLEDLLLQEHGLRLVRLENLGVEPILSAGEEKKNPAFEGGPNLFRHSMRLEFEGSYLRALGYLQRLEKMPKRLIWEELEIRAEDDKARIILTVHTLSLRRGWISA